jgi:hypothetical protein
MGRGKSKVLKMVIDNLDRRKGLICCQMTLMAKVLKIFHRILNVNLTTGEPNKVLKALLEFFLIML